MLMDGVATECVQRFIASARRRNKQLTHYKFSTLFIHSSLNGGCPSAELITFGYFLISFSDQKLNIHNRPRKICQKRSEKPYISKLKPESNTCPVISIDRLGVDHKLGDSKNHSSRLSSRLGPAILSAAAAQGLLTLFY
uniref:Uncharacterized protein n=1 Tax=Globodera rostochiensis TaxID=31243 RepID=A0A914HJW4_GLORO